MTIGLQQRSKTRRQRYDDKFTRSTKFPVDIATVNFMHDGNLGYVIRSAACFGAENVYVIGHLPPRKDLNPLSGSLVDYVHLKQFSNPSEFLSYAKNQKINLVAAEVVEGAGSLHDYAFPLDSRVCLVVGHEESGVPVEIMVNSDVVKIPMPGVGYCLNTSQAANIMLYEYTKQFMNI
tara:strand:+ start:2433 stop:2966 length:534 start_codon:yes stop_codon:yes gene_type:complete